MAAQPAMPRLTGIVTPTISSAPAPSDATNRRVSPSSSTRAIEQAAAPNRARVASTQLPRRASTPGARVMDERYRPTAAQNRHRRLRRGAWLTDGVKVPQVLQSLPDPDAKLLLRAGKVNHYARREVVVQEGDVAESFHI